jgi:hypothetical protein
MVDTVPNVPDTPPPPVTTQKAFTRSKNFGRDIAILSATYILHKHPELRKLIHLIVVIHDKDEDDQVMLPGYCAYSSNKFVLQLIDVLEKCARFSVQLASLVEAHSAEATEAITTFIK